MSDSDEVVVAVCSDIPEFDEDLVVAPSSAGPAGSSGDASRQRGRRWTYPSEDSFMCWMLVDASLASPARCARANPVFDSVLNTESLLALGVARCKWVLKKWSAEAVEAHTVVSGQLPSSSRTVCFLQYEIQDIFLFDEDKPLFQHSQRQTCRRILSEAYADFKLNDELGNVTECMSKKELDTSLILPVAVASLMLEGNLQVVNSIHFSRQIRYNQVLTHFPERYLIKHFWDAELKRLAAPPANRVAPAAGSVAQVAPHESRHRFGKRRLPPDAKLKLPTKKSKFDPIRLIFSAEFQHFLRGEANFSKALAVARKVDHDPSDDEMQPRDASKDPSTSTRIRARHKLDVVIMHLGRDEWAEWVSQDLVLSIHVYSDASPVVGVELQGQLLDIFLTSDKMHRRILPGAQLAYGLTDRTSKCITLVWGMFLTMGPQREKLEHALSKVVSITTDNGTEIGLLCMPDVLDAFYRWMDGHPLLTLKECIKDGSRLFPNSVRVIDLGHTMGGIMWAVCNSYTRWPTYNIRIRTLVHFFRNMSYRKHLQTCLTGRCDIAPLEHFEASFIKWRYQSVAVAIDELLLLRQICEDHFVEELFNDVKDKASLRKAVEAAKDKAFWRWLAVPGKRVVGRLERFRRWGMICSCTECNRTRKETKKPVECDRNSRRMDEMWTETQKLATELRTSARSLKPPDCEGDEQLCVDSKTLMLKAANLVLARNKYYSLIPWLFSKANESDGAQECLRQLEEADEERLDALSLRIKRTMLDDLRTVAAGGEVSAQLLQQVKQMKNTPVDGSPGEGYHRETNLARSRAPVSSTQTVVQAVRFGKGMDRVNEFLATRGKEGRNIVRYEWRHWKRILQVSRRKLHRGKALSEKQAYARLYRQDSMARDNWSLLVNPTRSEQPDVPDDGADGAQREYVREVLRPNVFFSMEPNPPPRPAAASSSSALVALPNVAPQEPFVFRIEEMHYGQHRPKYMPTHESHKDIALHAKLAVLVQPYDLRVPFDAGAGRAVVYPSAEPRWMDHSGLGTFNDLCYRLFECKKVEHDEDQPECLVLSDRQLARPTIPITDEKCPVLCLIWHLQALGWMQIKKKDRSHSRERRQEGP